MDLDKIKEYFETYFALKPEETEKLYNKNITYDHKHRRLEKILTAVCPFCDNFLDTEEKRKHKVGVKILSELNYNNFDESLEETYYRLKDLFKDITDRKINPYKVIYSGVLTDGNLGNDFEKNVKYIDQSRQFVNIYDQLKKTLKINDEEAAKIFERCSTLISKVYAKRIPQIYDKIAQLNINHYKIFTDNKKFADGQTVDEIVEILKINPSLFSSSPEKIDSSFRYLREKIQPLIDRIPRHFYDDEKLNRTAYQIWLLRNWIKNNSSLLSISDYYMNKKENFVRGWLERRVKCPEYKEAIDLSFQNPVTLALFNQINYNKMLDNTKDNVLNLENFAKSLSNEPYKLVADYIQDNPYFFSMPNKNFSELLNEVGRLEDENLKLKFFRAGKTLFASKPDFSIDEIINKLKSETAMKEIGVDSLEGMALIEKFKEIFAPERVKIVPVFTRLISERVERQQRGEKFVRVEVRQVGERIRNLSKHLKDDKVSNYYKLAQLKGICELIDEINSKRMRVQNVENMTSVFQKEETTALEIERVLNNVRTIYEDNRFKVGKTYIDSDKLYKKMMDYLGIIFDDKEAIESVFNKEITTPFVEILEDNYSASYSNQISMTGRKLDIPKIENKQLESQLRKTSKSIAKGDSSIEFSFDK